MIINVGTSNNIKVEAVRELVEDYPFLRNFKVVGVNVSSEVSAQPKTLKETIEGARNRAGNCFRDCKYSIGIESGITPVPYTKSGYMNITACAIFDGNEFHLGLSSGFDFPEELAKFMVEDGMELDDAVFMAGLSDNPRIGKAEGIIGLFTRGRRPRKKYAQQALMTALIHVEP